MGDFSKLYYCEKCNKTMDGDQFYSSNDLTKYPEEGKLHQCKKCITMHVDNWDPETYKWILKEIDVPYIPEEWNGLLAKYARNRSAVTGTTILGRYLSKMKLKQFREYRWKDTEFLQELANHKIEETMKRQGYSAAEIAEALEKGTAPINAPAPILSENTQDFADSEDGVGVPEWYAQPEDDSSDFDLDLSEEDKTYLRLKWGKSYKPDEWVWLEQMYNDMMNSYDIQSAGHIDTLKLICKTSLKANQLIDIGDVEGYQKVAKVYDGLMKSGKFTAAQNKAESGEYVDSISELVAICEKDGFIPRYYVDEPNDKVDRVLQDLQGYTRSLIMDEMNLGQLIENAVKQISVDKVKEAEEDSDNASDDDAFEEQLFSDNAESLLNDEAYTEFHDYEDELAEMDEAHIQEVIDSGEVK